MSDVEPGRFRRVAVRIVRAPVELRTWRELGYLLASLVPAVPAFALVLVGIVASALSLLTVGLPILVGVLVLTRGVSWLFRLVARAVLGWDRPLPPPVHGRNPARWALATLRDGAGWKTLLYAFVKFPLTVVGAYIGGVSMVLGVLAVTYPLWWVVAPDWIAWSDDEGWGRSWLLAAQGVGVLLVAPWFIRLLVAVDRFLVRALLEPSADQARIAALETSRAVLTEDAATMLRRLERDLHDGTQARLVQLGLALSRIGRRSTEPEVKTLVTDAQGTVEEALAELRDIVRGIHPPALDDGLPTALSTLAARSGMPVDVTVDLAGRPTDASAVAVYFTVAELLTNVARHAGANRAAVRLADDGRWLRLVVTDDGRGGATTGAGGPNGEAATGAGTGPSGTGLAGLARRAAALDGTFDVVSPAGGPTIVTMRIPR